jgi:phage tail-like protein
MANEPKADRAYSAAHFALALDGVTCGVIRSMEGGGVKVDVTSYRVGAHHPTWKQLGKAKFEPIKLQIGMAVATPFAKWIEGAFAGDFQRKNGALQAGDFFYKERARRDFTNAIISEVTLPALNAADKNAAYMGVSIVPEKITFTKGGGGDIARPEGSEKQKLWTACNFDFVLDGLDQAVFRRVTKIEALTIKTSVIEYHVGGQLEPYKSGSRMEYPNITITMPEADIQPVADALQAYWNKKEPRAPSGGHIDYLDSELKPLATLGFTGANIVSITPDRSDATSEELKMVKVEIVTETMTLGFK